MDNLRLFLVCTLGLFLALLWQAWEEDYGTKATGQPVVQTTGSPNGQATGVPSVPTGQGVPNPVTSSGTDLVPTPATMGNARTANAITVITDLYNIVIDPAGGTIASVLLNDYPENLGDEENKFQLMRSQNPDKFIAQSGLIAGEGINAPNHEALYQAEASRFEMKDGQESLVVDLTWVSEDKVKVTKRFSFSRGSYLVKVDHIVENHSAKDWSGRDYRQLLRSEPSGAGESKFLYTYTGGAIYSQAEKYEKIAFEDMVDKKLDRDIEGGWLAVLQHYFVSAWVPPANQTNHFYTNVLANQEYVLGAYTPPVTLVPGTTHTFSSGFLASPKLQDELEAISEGLELSVDYGWLTVVAKPIFWLLKQIQSVVVNWGLSIILLTMMIKAVFFKLSETSYKSMANMRKLTPRIQALKDRHGDDKQRMNQAMMELYKKEKVNPLNGCLPILVQIPVFIALYWVLLESVELRQAPFILWLDDLSVKDPFFVLPLLMGISMFIQQKLNPTPPDPMQAKIMMSLPIVFTVFFAFFPSGLVLYWVTNNILSISQQYYITRQIEKAD